MSDLPSAMQSWMRGLGFPDDLARVLVVAHGDELDMPDMVRARPFEEIEPGDQFGPHPRCRMPDYAAWLLPVLPLLHLSATLFGMISFSLHGVAEWLQNTQKRPLYFRGAARFGIGGAGAQCGSEWFTQS
jgi:hypothetical protein